MQRKGSSRRTVRSMQSARDLGTSTTPCSDHVGNGGHTMTERRRTYRPDSWRRYTAGIAIGLLTAVVAGCGPAIGTLSSGGGGTSVTTAATTSTASNTLS